MTQSCRRADEPSGAAAEVAADRRVMIEEVSTGLRSIPKRLPSKYFYDGRGSHLFERICELDAYYPTRTELAIMERHCDEMAAAAGPAALVVEYGSGASVKTEILLAALDQPAACILIDISREHLQASAERLGKMFPEVEILSLEADYTADFELPAPSRPAARRLLYFPGSTIGNFDRGPAREFLRRMARVAGPGGGLLIGVDLIKDREVLELAYDDPEGVTAAFNLNMLAHLNRELGTDFDLGRYRHAAPWNAAEARIEMHLVSVGAQTVHLDGESFELADGEPIVTEHSNKFDLDEFAGLAANAGWQIERAWTDERRWFSVQYLRLAGD
ncbi:MAG: L-histidine N(alpha)-methyltransferase [Thermoanaerobaculia bacterium]